MHNPRLFRLAVEAGSVTFHHVPAEGWTVTFWLRHGDEKPSEVQREHYSGLGTAELLDVISAHLDTHL